MYFSIVTPFGVIALTIFFLQMGLHIAYAYLVSVNLVVFLLYGYDKRQSAAKSLRVPEIWLHLPALLAGCVGSLAGQLVFRHKTRKLRFQIVFWAVVALEIVLAVVIYRAYFSPS